MQWETVQYFLHILSHIIEGNQVYGKGKFLPVLRHNAMQMDSETKSKVIQVNLVLRQG
jgi:hypothetical protein